MADTSNINTTSETSYGAGSNGSSAYAVQGSERFASARTGRPLAVVTGASSGIGYELARLSALNGYDLVVAAKDAKIRDCGQEFAKLGANVRTVEADLATAEGVDHLLDAARQVGPVEVLCANAGRGLGHAFLDQDWAEVREVIDTNITGTVYLLHKIGQQMRDRNRGRILITGSIAGFVPGSYQAVYNATKAFVDSFSYALRNELQNTGVTVTLLIPGATETNFFKKAHMTNTPIGASEKDDPLSVALSGFNAMMAGKGSVVHGFKNKLQAIAGAVLPQGITAEQHRKQAQPFTGR